MCKEKNLLINLLKKNGYSSVKIPKTGIRPAMILEKTANGYQQPAKLTQLFDFGDYFLPKLETRKLSDILHGKVNTEVNNSVGVELLKSWFAKGIIGGKSEIENMKKETLEFDFNNTTETLVNEFELDVLINKVKPSTESLNFKEKLLNNELFVILSILEAESFTVKSEKNTEFSFNGEVTVSEIAEASTENSIKKEKESTGKADETMVLGFKAARIMYSKDTKRFNLKHTKPIVLYDHDKREYTSEFDFLINPDDNFVELGLF